MNAPSRLADELLAAQAAAALVPLPSQRDPTFDLDAAYAVAGEIARRRVASGERPRGWKIGFTNRTIWPRYGVHQPIWGRVWDTTLTLLDDAEAEVSLAGLVQPRIEPEIVFGLARTPSADMDLEALARCVDWVAHGVEIVHTHYDGWRFGGAADTVADFGLHGRLLVGPRVAAASWPALAADLSALRLSLSCDGHEIEVGHGANVLDGPLHALWRALQAMARQRPLQHVAAGEVVTTGTLTDAWAVRPGQRWHTRPGDERLAGLGLRCLT